MDVICAIFPRDPRQKTETSPHRWCSVFTIKLYFSSCSLMPHVLQILRENSGGKTEKPYRKLSPSGYSSQFFFQILYDKEVPGKKQMSWNCRAHHNIAAQAALALSFFDCWQLNPASPQPVHILCAHSSLGSTERQKHAHTRTNTCKEQLRDQKLCSSPWVLHWAGTVTAGAGLYPAVG